MKRILSCYLNTFFGKDLELRARLFHVLAITGFVICLAMTWVSLTGEMYFNMAINIGTGAVTLALLIYSTRTGNYRVCCRISIPVIFFILFPSLFFCGGGYQGGMPFFFVFAVVFTVFLLDGKTMVLASFAELVYYSLLVTLAYRKPETVIPFASGEAVVRDIIIGFVTVSISLGATMFVQVRMYRRQQKELEQARLEAESASRAKSIFLASMSHEIRTPIHVILGMNEVIHRESRNRQIRDYSRRIGETGKMLLSLVENVLDVSKIESGNIEITPAAYETEELVRTLEIMGKTQCSGKKLQFRVSVSPDLPEVLCGDLPHIRQIATNFLSNAVKYTPQGSVTLKISGEPEEKGILLCISVSDTGVGMCREDLPGIFDAFSRAEGTRQIQGTGLGLNIVKRLTDLMGGTVTVDSRPGEGSTFTVKLPQQVLPRDSLKESSSRRLLLAPEARVLVVDDNEGNRAVMKQLLAVTEMTVDTADSGRACLDMAAKHSYDLILMDYMMPELDGAQTLQQLQSLPDFRTPAIALTADASPETARMLRKAGFAMCLTKPVPWHRLRNALLQCLEPGKATEYEEPIPRPEDLEAQEQLLLPYGLRLQDAMEYFETFADYCATARLFLRYDSREQERAGEALRTGDWERLRLCLHALKGKAGNLGANRLAELCGYGETLCVRQEAEELCSFFPYLQFVWRRCTEGLQKLMEHSPEAEKTEGRPEPPEKLRDYLKTFQRKPALDWIAARLGENPKNAGNLKKLQQLVEQFRFDEALEAMDLQQAEEEETK